MMYKFYTSLGKIRILVYFVNRDFNSCIKDLDARRQQAVNGCKSCTFEDLKRSTSFIRFHRNVGTSWYSSVKVYLVM
jgi:hypothetical protein